MKTLLWLLCVPFAYALLDQLPVDAGSRLVPFPTVKEAARTLQTARSVQAVLNPHGKYLEAVWNISYENILSRAVSIQTREERVYFLRNPKVRAELADLVSLGIQLGYPAVLHRILWDRFYYKTCELHVPAMSEEMFAKFLSSMPDLQWFFDHPPRPLDGSLEKVLQSLVKQSLRDKRSRGPSEVEWRSFLDHPSDIGLKGESKSVHELDPDNQQELNAYRLRMSLEAIFVKIYKGDGFNRGDGFNKGLFEFFVRRLNLSPVPLRLAVELWSQTMNYIRARTPQGHKVQWIPHHIRIWWRVLQSLGIANAEDPRLHDPEETELDRLLLYIWKRFMVDGVYAQYDQGYKFVYSIYSVLRHRGYQFTQTEILNKHGEPVTLGENPEAEEQFKLHMVYRPVFVPGQQTQIQDLFDRFMEKVTGWQPT